MTAKKLRRSQRYGPPPANREKGNPGNREKICALINFPDYYLQYTFIRAENNGYRLAVIHFGQVKTNECFPTMEAAKNAFASKYNGKSWNKDAVPRWTELYEPNLDWLDDKIQILKWDTQIQQKNKLQENSPKIKLHHAPVIAMEMRY
jgi:hypothetical protein